MKFHLSRRAVAAMLALSAAAPAFAADPFPTRPIRFIVNASPGGSLDITTRLVAQKMSEKLGQSVIVDNRAGADGLVGIRAVLSAKPDGYTILATAGTIAIQPAIKQDPGYDLLKDFTGVGAMLRSPFLVLVGADQPDKTLGDFIARAKANPGKLSYASAGMGTTTHIAAAMFAHQAGLSMLHVPYKGSGGAYADVAGGRIPMIFTGYSSGHPFLASGKMRPLGVTSPARMPNLPDVPTVAEQGLPGYSYAVWLGLLAPAATPPEVVAALSDALRAAQTSKDLGERFKSEGSDATPATPAEFNAFLKRDLAEVQKLVTALGLPKE